MSILFIRMDGKGHNMHPRPLPFPARQYTGNIFSIAIGDLFPFRRRQLSIFHQRLQRSGDMICYFVDIIVIIVCVCVSYVY